MKVMKAVNPARIVHAGEPVLRQQARPVTPEELRGSEMQHLIEVMRETMHAAPGVGLAAPQIGLALQLAVIEDKAEYVKDVSADFLRERERKPVLFHVIANPKLTVLEEERRDFFEGCLSLPGFTAMVPRARHVRVECLDAQGKPTTIDASGWYARILQHEIDHLHGTLYIDRMHSRTFMGLDNFEKFYKGKSMSEVMDMIAPVS